MRKPKPGDLYWEDIGILFLVLGKKKDEEYLITYIIDIGINHSGKDLAFRYLSSLNRYKYVGNIQESMQALYEAVKTGNT